MFSLDRPQMDTGDRGVDNREQLLRPMMTRIIVSSSRRVNYHKGCVGYEDGLICLAELEQVQHVGDCGRTPGIRRGWQRKRGTSGRW
jgi:hypothetical protein